MRWLAVALVAGLGSVVPSLADESGSTSSSGAAVTPAGPQTPNPFAAFGAQNPQQLAALAKLMGGCTGATSPTSPETPASPETAPAAPSAGPTAPAPPSPTSPQQMMQLLKQAACAAANGAQPTTQPSLPKGFSFPGTSPGMPAAPGGMPQGVGLPGGIPGGTPGIPPGGLPFGAPSGPPIAPAPPTPDEQARLDAALAPYQKAIDAILSAPDAATAEQATRVVLARAGVGFTDSPQSSGGTPPGGLRLSPEQIAAVTGDARQRATVSRTDLAEFAVTLQAAGVSYKQGVPPGLAFADFLAGWAQAAAQNPDDPAGAPVLLLAALARRQSPPIDITQANYNPANLRLGFLDLNLMAAGLARLGPAFGLAPPASAGAAPIGPVAALWDRLVDVVSPRAYAEDLATPCSNLKDQLNKDVALGGDLAGTAVSKYVSFTIGTEVDLITELVGKDGAAAAKAVGKLLETVGQLMKVQALLELYTKASAQAQILSDNPIHQPSEHAGPLYSAVKVVAGVPDDEWKAFKAKQKAESSDEMKALKDCAGFAGLPVITDPGDIAGQVTNWIVRWTIEGGVGIVEYADPTDMDFPGSQRNFLKRENDHQGSDVLPLRILSERDIDHPGDLIHVPVTIKAEVATDPPPNLGTVLGMFGGDVLDLLVGWWQSLDTLDASATLDVTHHQFNPGMWHGTITIETHLLRDKYSNEDVLGGSVRSNDYAYTHRVDQIAVNAVSVNGVNFAQLVASDEASFDSVVDSTVHGETTSGCRTVSVQESHESVYGHGRTDNANIGISWLGAAANPPGTSQYRLDITSLPVIEGSGFERHSIRHQSKGGCKPLTNGDGDFGPNPVKDVSGPAQGVISIIGRLNVPYIRLPDHLHGSVPIKIDNVTMKGTMSVTWDLQRTTH